MHCGGQLLGDDGLRVLRDVSERPGGARRAREIFEARLSGTGHNGLDASALRPQVVAARDPRGSPAVRV